MEFTQFLDAKVRPGGLAEWIPAVPGGLGSWHRDPRGTSHNHEQHLRAAHDYRLRTQREGGREAWLGLAVEFDEQISLAAIRTAILGWINRHEVLRTHVTLVGEDTARYTTDPGTVHLRMTRIGWYQRAELLMEQIGGSFDRATTPLHWPAYRFATVARAHSFTLLFAADHSLVDGYSLINAQYELRELYAAAVARRAPHLPPTGSYIDFSGAERTEADAADDRHTAVAAWQEFLAGRPELPPFAVVPAADGLPSDPADPSTPAQRSRTQRLLDDDAAEALARRCTDLGGSLVGGILAAAAQVYRAHSGVDRFATLMPRHTRNHARFHGALGWFVALAPVTIDVSDDPDFPTALERIMVSLDHAKEGAALPLLRLAEILGFTPEPKFVVSFMDTRAVPGAAAADEGAAQALRSHAYADDEFYLWVNRTPGGLRMHARFPAPAADPGLDAILQGFVDDFADLLASIARDG
ncbi:condensation domain-containing protein [Gordonia alkaliphila]|uniref:condensation domain-containing protein n=1 Tax=Gordonia alkaliphila TaxID=1053547 RepID=UPI001FF3E4AB|nr:condensation domain-containing protein [Gordonia alkaliphila]MCK0440060.1 condensation domain-containing protein [Gordonia alkaliphila]